LVTTILKSEMSAPNELAVPVLTPAPSLSDAPFEPVRAVEDAVVDAASVLSFATVVDADEDPVCVTPVLAAPTADAVDVASPVSTSAGTPSVEDALLGVEVLV
jgi:hypothetical protein